MKHEEGACSKQVFLMSETSRSLLFACVNIISISLKSKLPVGCLISRREISWDALEFDPPSLMVNWKAP